jgi:ABC-type transport system involved in multi-copper enzyme maturation permease subunit
LILLMAISLPLLAIIRVMGGVPWNYVISSLCINLTTIIFVGSLSLFFSIFSRRTYVVIIITILTIAFFFALLPLLTAWIWHAMDLSRIISEKIPMLDRIILEKIMATVIFSPNFYCTMFFNSMMMVEPRAAAGMPANLWPLNCGIMLAASALLLFVSMIIVRKVALRQATGQMDSPTGKRRLGRADEGAGDSRPIFAGTIRRVVGPPIIWKELRSPMFRHHKIRTFIFVFIALILLSGTYLLCATENALDDEEVHAAYAIIFLGIGMLFTIVLPATSITTEIESRSWPVLLATPLDDKDILLGKFIGTLRRCFPAWLLLFGHIIAFSVIGFIHPFAIVQTGILVTWIAIFLSGSGLYFSSRFKHTTTAVLMNFALVATIWAILPLLMAIAGSINTPFKHEARVIVEAYIDTNPFVHMGNIIIATVGEKPYRIGSYYWPGQGTLNAVGSTILMLVCMVGYILIGLIFAWRAKCQFRRKIF